MWHFDIISITGISVLFMSKLSNIDWHDEILISLGIDNVFKFNEAKILPMTNIYLPCSDKSWSKLIFQALYFFCHVLSVLPVCLAVVSSLIVIAGM